MVLIDCAIPVVMLLVEKNEVAMCSKHFLYINMINILYVQDLCFIKYQYLIRLSMNVMKYNLNVCLLV